MLSGISLSGAIAEILTAAAMIVAGFASIWAAKRVINLLRGEAVGPLEREAINDIKNRRTP